MPRYLLVAAFLATLTSVSLVSFLQRYGHERVAASELAAAVSAGGGQTYAITVEGGVKCWCGRTPSCVP